MPLGSSGGGGGAYGGIPRVPSLPGAQSEAIGSNLGNLTNLYNLATGAGSASGAGVIKALEEEIPGVGGQISDATRNISELLGGQVPADVVSQLRQQAAELGIGAGQGAMSPFSNAAYLKALGLTSLGMKQQGMTALDQLMGSVPRAPAFDPASMFITPGMSQDVNWLRAQMAAAPDPAAARQAELDALRMGMGAGQSPMSFGGVGSRPAVGGPAFPDVRREPSPWDTGFPTFPTFGPAGGGTSTIAGDPYERWRQFASSLPSAGGGVDWMGLMPGEGDMYAEGLGPVDQFGLMPGEFESFYGGEGGAPADYGGGYEDFYGE